MCTAGSILRARTVEKRGCSILSHDRQQGSLRQRTHNLEMGWGGNAQNRWPAFRQCAFSQILTSSVSIYRRSPSRPSSTATQAASQRLGWQLHQAGKRTGGSEEEVVCHRSGTHMNSGSLSSDSEETHVFGLRCSDCNAPEGGNIVLIIR